VEISKGKGWMKNTLQWARRAVGLIVLAWVLAALGCVSVGPPVGIPSPHAALPGGASWWYLRFRMEWPEGRPPMWHTDLLLADQVVRPVLERRGTDIALWRFHRRAARDGAGHQFSFIFYASPETARAVFTDIDASAALRLARASGRVAAVDADDPDHPSRPGRADTSDPAWSPALRDAWPYYLMGASRMWLDLVSQLASPPAEADAGFADWDAAYARADTAVTAVWQAEGRHAFLHHLNALFGYEPLPLRF
jgi:hypothetical protein